MNENKVSNSEKSSITPKSVCIVLATIIIVIAAAVGIALGLNVAFGQKAEGTKTVTAEQPVYTMKLNEETNEEEYYDQNGKLAYKVQKATGDEEHFDESGKLEYKIHKDFKDFEKTIVTRVQYLNPNGQTTKSIVYKEGTEQIDFVDEYENGKISVHHVYENGKDTGTYSKSEYDESGKESICTIYDANDKIISKKEETHNKNGTPVLFKKTDASGKVLEKTEYSYDKNGNNIKAVFYDSKGITGHIEKEFNSDNQIVKMNEFDKNGKLVSYRTYTYDKDGVPSEKIFDAKGKEAKN